jgi:glycosyltransferase involved in cell wall biosynthesis
VLEAMACGLPVVTTRYAGASELIDHGTSGVLVEPDDIDGLTGAIRGLGDRTTREQMGSAAAEVGRAHDEQQNFAEVLRVFQRAVERGTGPVR